MRLVVFRFVPALLLIAVVLLVVTLINALIGRLGEQSAYDQHRDAYRATATALSGAASAADVARIAYRQQEIAQFATNTLEPAQFAIATNTPQITAFPTETPVPATPRPLPTLFVFEDRGGQELGGTLVPTAFPAIDRRGQDLMNILVLGQDGEISGDTDGRTDTMILVSINRTAGTVTMLSLPRDLYVYIPGWTMQRLNTAFVRGEAVGWTDGGFGLLRQTIFYNLGINAHYYAMVNLSGFKAIIDTLGGVDIAVDCAIQDLPLIDTEMPRAAVRVNDDGYHVLPVGYYTMNGAEALWYARSRYNSTDFDRGRRQQQLLRAIWRKALASGLLNNVVPLWNEGSQYLRTNLRLEDMLGLLPLALSLDPTGIQNYTFAPTYHTAGWRAPDGSSVQLPNPDTMPQLLTAFYTPPTTNQLLSEPVTLRVFNGTANADWDRVAADSLGWRGLPAAAAGAAATRDYAETILIDYTGRAKGSSRDLIAASLNIRPENIRVEPDANREVDYAIIVGANYNSCTAQGILPVDPLPAD